MRFKFELAEISKKATLSKIRCRSEFLNKFENNYFPIEQGLSSFFFCVLFELLAYPCVQKITLQHRNSLKICKWHKGIMVMKRLLKINNKFKFLLFHLIKGLLITSHPGLYPSLEGILSICCRYTTVTQRLILFF